MQTADDIVGNPGRVAERTSLAVEGDALKSGVARLWGSQVARRAARMLFLVVAARVLGPTQFGTYILLLTVTEMVAGVSGAGFGDFITRELSRSADDAYPIALRVIQLRMAYGAAAGIVALGALTVLGYNWTVLRLAVIMAASLFPRAVFDTAQGAVRAAERFGRFAVLDLVQGATLLGIGAYLLYRGFGLAGAVWAELAAILVASLVGLVTALDLFPRTASARPGWRALIRQTLPFNFFPLIIQMYDRVDVVLISKLASDAAVGFYSLPYKLYASLQIFPYGIMGALLPRLSRCDWGEDTRQRFRRLLDLLYAAALLVVLVTTFLATPLLAFLLGPKYAGSALALKIVIWATVPMCLNYALNTCLLATMQERIFLITASGCVLVNVAANMILIPHFSYYAAAAVTVLTECFLLAQNLYFVRRRLGVALLPERLLRTTLIFALAFGFILLTARYLPLAYRTGTFLVCVSAFGWQVWRAFRHAISVAAIENS